MNEKMHHTTPANFVDGLLPEILQELCHCRFPVKLKGWGKAYSTADHFDPVILNQHGHFTVASGEMTTVPLRTRECITECASCIGRQWLFVVRGLLFRTSSAACALSCTA
jgi:hypothetical protein